MHRSGGKPPSAGSVSTSASPARLPATAGRSLSSADPYLLLPISTAYERRGSGRRTAAAAPDEGVTATTPLDGAPIGPSGPARPSSKANPAAPIRSAAAAVRSAGPGSGGDPPHRYDVRMGGIRDARQGDPHGKLAARPVPHPGRILREALGDDDRPGLFRRGQHDRRHRPRPPGDGEG